MKNPYRITDLNAQEKPREKLVTAGVSSLTDEELLSIIIRSGGKDSSALDTARKLLKKYGDFKHLLNTDIEELLTIKNIGIAKATCIKAMLEIAVRMKETPKELTAIKNPEDVYNLMYKHLYGKQKEHLYLINLNSRNHPISQDLLTIGTTDQTLVSSKDIYKKALAKNASYIILVHNHPSNDPTPSVQDIKITEEVAETGKKIGIPLIDHLIFSDSKYVSLKSLNLFNTYKVNTEKR